MVVPSGSVEMSQSKRSGAGADGPSDVEGVERASQNQGELKLSCCVWLEIETNLTAAPTGPRPEAVVRLLTGQQASGGRPIATKTRHD